MGAVYALKLKALLGVTEEGRFRSVVVSERKWGCTNALLLIIVVLVIIVTFSLTWR